MYFLILDQDNGVTEEDLSECWHLSDRLHLLAWLCESTTIQLLGSPERWAHATKYSPIVIGGIEFIGAILLLIPSTATLAALVLCGIMVGAFVTHATAGEYMMLPVNVILFAGLAYVAWARSNDLLGSKSSDSESGAEVAAA